MKVYAIALLVSLTTICQCELSLNRPLVYPNWPPKPQNVKPPLRHHLMYQMRSGDTAGSGRYQSLSSAASSPLVSHSNGMFYKRTPVAASMTIPHRLLRPMKTKSSNVPHYFMKNHSPAVYLSKPNQFKFHSSPPGPNTGEYVFENPFKNTKSVPSSSVPLQQQQQSSTPSIGNTPIVHPTYNNPIHTIPAPNLSLNKPYAGTEFLTEPLDNHIYEKEIPITAQFQAQRPNIVHQYQVTEQTHDHILRDPITGIQKLYAPDPDPSLPAYKIASNEQFAQKPQQQTFSSHNIQQQSPSASALVQHVQPYIQLANENPQQQLPDSYALPLTNQPQLQQHMLQQQQTYMPMSVYNPTYLVTQSNQLFNQHKQHLFKPEPKYQDNDPATSVNFQQTYNINAVASPGQIFAASQDQHKDFATIDFETSASQNEPVFERLVASRNQFTDNLVESNPQQPSLTEHEIANLLNFGRLTDAEIAENPSGFVASNYYQNFPTSDIEQTNLFAQRQRENEEIINKANQELELQKQLLEQNAAQLNYVTTGAPETTMLSLHEQHQQKLAEHFENSDDGSSPLRIYVPDVDLTNPEDNFQKRSDEDYSLVEEIGIDGDSITSTKRYDYETQKLNNIAIKNTTERFNIDLSSKIDDVNLSTEDNRNSLSNVSTVDDDDSTEIHFISSPARDSTSNEYYDENTSKEDIATQS